MSEYRAIDLFSGAGGFSLGMEQAGFRVIAAVDSDPHAVAVYKENFDTVATHVISSDIKKMSPKKFTTETGIDGVDVIFGGPPCQGFSTANPRNHGTEVVEDERRNLYKNFLNYVEALNPRVFVMENVRGIKKTAGGKLFQMILEQAGNLGYQVHHEELFAWHYGIPQKRIRCIIFGVRNDIPFTYPGKWVLPTHADTGNGDTPTLKSPVNLWEAICDLPILQAGQSVDKYDIARRMTHNSDYIANIAKPEEAAILNGHSARMHSTRDLRDFKKLREGQSSAEALREGVEMEFPYNREVFKDRYTKQHRKRLSSTIIAHLSKDGLMFIHPTQNRSLTPREAARIQSFPDKFIFSCPRTHQFRLIGNAVPPLMGRAIGMAAMKELRAADFAAKKNAQKKHPVALPERRRVAAGGG